MKDMGFADKNGDPIPFEQVETIIDKVIDYNDNNEDRKATIQSLNG